MKKPLDLKIASIYPQQLNLYGDRGNVEALVYSCKAKGVKVKVIEIDRTNRDNKKIFDQIDIILMGGGPDNMQKEIFDDFKNNKGPYIKEYFKNNKVGLFICGSYQLLGDYYRPYSGDDIVGLRIADFYTKNFGLDKPRCVGNLVVEISGIDIETGVSKYLVGFENHGGRTFISKDLQPLGTVKKGFGNNETEKNEGVVINNFIGTYLHGPLLPKNPHMVDFLIEKSLEKKYKNKFVFEKEPNILAWKAHFSILRKMGIKIKAMGVNSFS